MLSIIVATDINGGIGYKGDLLFHIKEDMKRFKELTTGHTIIMGRKTFESLPNGALPNRENIVVTKNALGLFNKYEKEFMESDKLFYCNDINNIITNYKSSKEEVFVIGGGNLYQQLLPYCNKIYLTKVHSKKDADTFFNFNEDEWEIIYWSLKSDNEYKYEFLDLIRKEPN